MSNLPVYLAVYKTATGTYLIEYRPLWDERPAGGIEVISIFATHRPQGIEELREASRNTPMQLAMFEQNR